MLAKLLLTLLFVTNLLLGISQEIHKEITLEDIFQSRLFTPQRISDIHPMNNGEFYCCLTNDSLNVYDFQKGNYIRTIITSEQLIPGGESEPISMQKFVLSADENKILFATETEQIYRHSNKSNYFIYDLKSNLLFPLSNNGKQRLAAFSPDATKVAFVRDNNIFIKDLNVDSEEQITYDGLDNEIINGATDWVHEEEFGFSKAYFWSADSKKIAFYRFNETNVKEFQMTIWGDLYPEQYKFKYPKAGEDNSLVELQIYNLDTKETIPINIITGQENYIPRIKWTNDPEKLSIRN